MNPIQIIQSIFSAESLQKASLVTLKPGQLLYGRIEKFLSNDTALIQIGKARLVAHLKVSVSTEDSYWFEVRSSGDEGIQLKVVEGKGQGVSAQLLLEHFQLSDTKLNRQLVQFFLSENVPFTKEQLSKVASWISNSMDANELSALEWMIKKDLPFTKQTFQSLVAVQESESFSQQLEKVGSYLEDPKFSSFKTIQSLKQMITTILGNHSIDELSNGIEVKQMLQAMVKSIGLEYEKDVQLWAKNEENSIESLQSLKSLLIGAMTELGTSGRELEPILNRLTGMQLISQDLTGPMQQMVMQLPLSFGDKHTDVTLQWNGRKTNTGQIDPDYCRILFYLDLQSLNQMVIDMQVQTRVIHVSIINDTKGIQPIVTALTPALKEKLESIGYKLSFINVVPSFEKRTMDPRQMSPDLFSNELYQRVDIKI
jgi:hypothetical protein